MLAERVAEKRNKERDYKNEMKNKIEKFVERLRDEAARWRLKESQNSMETIDAECVLENINSMRNVFQRTIKNRTYIIPSPLSPLETPAK